LDNSSFLQTHLKKCSQAGHWWLTPVNTCYSGGRDQEDLGLKLAWEIVLKTLSQKTHHKKRPDGVARGDFKPHYHKIIIIIIIIIMLPRAKYC
jgi:hypothetical protein